MKAPNLHLNLLHASERQSSSPVRLRVMLPIFSALACAGCLLWWGILEGRLMLLKKDTAAVQKDIEAITPKYVAVTNRLNGVSEMRARIDQLSMYMNARHEYGSFLANVASNVPPNASVLELAIPEPDRQVLRVPDASKPGQYVNLPGPTNTVETVKFQIIGKASDEKPVKEFLEKLKGPAFANTLIHAGPKSPQRSYNDGDRTYTIEYLCTERRFEK